MPFALLPDGASNGSDSKKLRVEEAPPSRVLHIRKLPNEATETEIIALGLPFGKVTNILTLKGKNQVKTADSKPAPASWCQPVEPGGWAGGWAGGGALTAALCSVPGQAFLEMGTEEAAITMVNYYATVTPHVRNIPVFIQYSNHKELKTDAGNQVGAGSPCPLSSWWPSAGPRNLNVDIREQPQWSHLIKTLQRLTREASQSQLDAGLQPSLCACLTSTPLASIRTAASIQS